MSNVPFAIRLPEKLLAIAESIARMTGKTTSDTVRAGIEYAFSDEYRFQVIERTSDRAGTMKIVREFLSPEPDKTVHSLPLPIYSALMRFWHSAYLKSSGYANPDYVDALLTITSDLLDEAEKQHIKVDSGFYRNTLGLADDEPFASGIERVREKFPSASSASLAEFLTRPLEGMADSLQHFDTTTVARIFGRHLRLLLPVAVTGSETALDDDIIARDLKPLLPPDEKFTLGGMSVLLSPVPLALVFEEGHHCNAFGPESVIALYTGATHDAFAEEGEFRRGLFGVMHFGDTYILHVSGGYRLHLSTSEFQELSDHLRRILSAPGWQWLIKRHRDLRGDY